MYYADIKEFDIANGPGIRVSLFVSGCPHHCKNCFNKEAWDYQYGRLFTDKEIERILMLLEPDYIEGLTLLGGEPMWLDNQKGLLPLLQKVKEKYPSKTIWCYSGYMFDKEILEEMYQESVTQEFLSYIDVLVDGRFVETLAHKGLIFRGSSNQRVIDVQKSLKSQKIIEIKMEDKVFQTI